MTQSKYIRHIERNKILKRHYDHMMPEDEKQIIQDNIGNIIGRTRQANKNAKIGEIGSLEILYELGRFLNRVAD